MDTQFVTNKSLTFDCDFGLENLMFVRDTPSYVTLSFYEV